MEASTTTCKNCGNAFSGKFCNACGQKVYSHHDKRLSHLFEEGFHFLTHFEGTFFTTVKTIFSRPGKLSLDYCDGIRKRYFKPLSFFLLLVVIYLLFPAFEGLNMQLRYYPTHTVIGSYASQKIEALLAQGISQEELINQFHQKSEKLSKFLLLIIIPAAAMLCYLLTFRRRRYFFDQMVFAAEVSSFFLLWTFLIMGLFFALAETVYDFIYHHYFEVTDITIGTIAYVTFAVFLYLAARRFYGLKGWQAALFAMLFLAGFYIIVNWLYKFLLFAAVINQIH